MYSFLRIIFPLLWTMLVIGIPEWAYKKLYNYTLTPFENSVLQLLCLIGWAIVAFNK